jgi:hypothetical protein
MSWVDDYKGAGPWDFVEQGTKWGYVNNKRWSKQTDAQEFCAEIGLSLNQSTHKPCGHWHKTGTRSCYVPINTGRWMAAKSQPGEPYIYLYDVTHYAVVQIDTSQAGCPLVGQLVINEADWHLGYHNQYGSGHYSGTQRGGCCMSKDGLTLWYLFEGINVNDGDCKLVEVDITDGIMSITRTTIFGGLIDAADFINDGCTNDIYTFWSTNTVTGRIIKIRNSDHALIENHHFNYANPMEPIHSLDVDKGNSKLYWSYVTGCGGIPFCNAIAHHIEADLDFNVINSVDWAGMGAGTPQFQNWVRIFDDGYIYFDRVYYTTSGYLRRRNPGFLIDAGNTYIAPYNYNILDVQDGKIYCLHGDGSTANVTYLVEIDRFTMTVDNRVDVKYYAGTGYLLSYPWWKTACSAMNHITKKIMMFRWEQAGVVGNQGTGEVDRNWGAVFNADLELLDDIPYEQILVSKTMAELKADEPQIWTMDF